MQPEGLVMDPWYVLQLRVAMVYGCACSKRMSTVVVVGRAPRRDALWRVTGKGKHGWLASFASNDHLAFIMVSLGPLALIMMAENPHRHLPTKASKRFWKQRKTLRNSLRRHASVCPVL